MQSMNNNNMSGNFIETLPSSCTMVGQKNTNLLGIMQNSLPFHPLSSCTEAAQTSNTLLYLPQSTTIPTFDGEANTNGNYAATAESNPNNAFQVYQSTTRSTGSQTVHAVHNQYDRNIDNDEFHFSGRRRSTSNEQRHNVETISQTSDVESNDEAVNESHFSGRRRSTSNEQRHNVETISETSDVQTNDEAANESHFSGRRRSTSTEQPHNLETISQTSHVENDNEAANESHFHCKEWIDNLIEESITYYMKGSGKEEYRKRYTIENGKTYLGLEISMEPIRWNLLHCEKNPIKFVRMLALQIWSSETLLNRAVVLRKVTKKNRIPGHSPVKELERNKLKLLISIFADYLQSKEKKFSVHEQIQHLRKITSYLSKKINEMKNALKKNTK